MHEKTRRGRKTKGLVGGASLLWGLAVVGCGFDAALDDAEETFEGEVTEALRALFPDLSAEEIADLSASLSLEDVEALAAELGDARAIAAELSDALFVDAHEKAEEREDVLTDRNDGFPEGLEAVGRTCLYDSENQQAQVMLSGIFNGKSAVSLDGAASVSVSVGGETQSGALSCASGESVDIVFLIDITGSMGNVISSVRDSVVSFVDAIEARGISGTISVVSFQDTVGVNTTFQEVAPGDVERSPFFVPVAIDDADGVDEARSFINRLEANRGADAPENLSGAIDFARNNVIGGSAASPNTIDGVSDPPGTEAFPPLTGDRQVFVALTDSMFHSDNRGAGSSSLLEAFVPRNAQEILSTLHQTNTVVHVIDPSWVDHLLDPTADVASVDSDYWAIHTGGLGEDVAAGYSLVDLELVITAEESGLLDVALDGIISSSCTFTFDADLSAVLEVEVQIEAEGQTFVELVVVAPY